MSDIKENRKHIDEIDKQIADLFEQRMKESKIIAEYKKERALPIEDLNRENEIIKQNSAYIKDETIKEYYISFERDLMNISKLYQSRIISDIKIAYCGVEGAYAHIAAKKMYPESQLIAYSSFENAYRAVEKGECDICILPLENSFNGEVGEVMDLIFQGQLFINQVLDLDINHALLAKKGVKKEDIKVVLSHPQALQQCSEYIDKNHFETIEFGNTALAAKHIAESADMSQAVIASEETAPLYDLEILDTKINNVRNNTTRFGAFSRILNEPDRNQKMGEHFIIVFTVINEAGSLAKALNIIGAHSYNMRNLRSRPMKELMWNYYFFVELEGNVNTQDGKDMLNELRTVCDRLKLVGAYYSFKNK